MFLHFSDHDPYGLVAAAEKEKSYLLGESSADDTTSNDEDEEDEDSEDGRYIMQKYIK